MSHRVDTVPWPVRPLYLTVTWACGLALYLYYTLCRVTSRVSVRGPGNHDLSQHAIFCMWHESWWSYFVVFLRYRSPHAMMSHPAAYMKPAHVVFRMMGLRSMVLGSHGDEGRHAANEVSRLVREGCSTTISPDGPYGPPRVLKKGVLHIALQSGVPVVPITISAARGIPLRSWDSKRFPLPFNRIDVIVHEGLRVTHDNLDEARAYIIDTLGGPEPESHGHGARRWSDAARI